ncbi:MAG: hypothetical protein COB67_08400 [SAR324 cluster bacterium]|uniref:Acyl-CoA dehydrogenase n=1 Tax=SAR324 cluster bacterium TaxID=2024889 RepID=A0A2A4T1W8_9DELT|nr:MAG: hypothetical protein COB67_08400 [SAR324 cluster bacterium]
MNTYTYSADLEEFRFLLENIVQVNVLCHAPAFQNYSLEGFLETIEEAVSFAKEELSLTNRLGDEIGVLFRDGVVVTPAAFREAWEKIVEQKWVGLTAKQKYQGRQLPESVAVAIREVMAASNGALNNLAQQTNEISNLIETFGNEQQKELYCSKLAQGQWTATLSITEPQVEGELLTIRATAKVKGDYSLISGTKIMVAGGDHDLSENILHLVVAKIKDAVEDEAGFGLFLVPKYRLEAGNLVDNNLSTDNLHSTPGNRALPYCDISYGKEGECQGTLLMELDKTKPESVLFQQGLQQQSAVQSMALAAAAHNTVLQAQSNKVLSLDDAMTRDGVFSMQALVEGLRGLIYSSAFYLDCKQLAEGAQKETFTDLTELQIRILKVYASQKGLQVVREAMQLLGELAYSDEYPVEQYYRELLAGSLFGGTNKSNAQELLTQTLAKDEGRLFQTLLEQFQQQDMTSAKTDSLHDAVGIWRDFLGGAIVLFGELKGEEDAEQSNHAKFLLHADRILNLLGDLLLGFQLIVQALAAEKELKKQEVNFFNLQQDALNNPALRKWYNKILLAEYFAVNILSQQEGQIQIILRNSTLAMDALYEGEQL